MELILMRIIRFNPVTSSLKVEPHSFDDLYLLAIVISKGDTIEAKSTRRFRGHEKDVGEQKDITVRILVEKSEIDKNASRVRFTGKILGGHPEEFINMGSYHTVNIGPGDIVDIQKKEWKDYVIKRLKQAVADSKKPQLGIVVLDDEKALFSYVKGYGIDIISEIYSHLSKRLSEKDYAKARDKYFDEVIKLVNSMGVDIIVIAGPGFMKDDVKKYIESKHIEVNKRVVYAPSSDAERSGIREVMQGEVVAKLLANEHVRREFEYLNRFIMELRAGRAHSGMESVEMMVNEGNASAILVNDSIINDENAKRVLDSADRHGIRIEIFNSEDDAGIQLSNFKNIVCISK
ncbi:MAG: mRNA surveillance protein pelota [Candidatus Micrarchaeota archaeon]|nr:mRNA surveillance protein pelota [Candidatus Micrarchaeota archaeon]MDE1849980.1 mRNA surveillance protein pelota [Candidatus Micrarchaeota archaeon]